MKESFKTKVEKLKLSYHLFDEPSLTLKLNDILNISKNPLVITKNLVEYYEILIFLVAYPSSINELTLTEKELKRCTAFIKKNRSQCVSLFSNSGLPYTPYISKFSHDCNSRLVNLPYIDASFNGFDNPTIELGDALKHTLPIIEMSDASRLITYT